MCKAKYQSYEEAERALLKRVSELVKRFSSEIILHSELDKLDEPFCRFLILKDLKLIKEQKIASLNIFLINMLSSGWRYKFKNLSKSERKLLIEAGYSVIYKCGRTEYLILR